MAKNNNHKAVSYNKWGYIFLIPFVVVYLIFQVPFTDVKEATAKDIPQVALAGDDDIEQMDAVIAVGSPTGDYDSLVSGMITSVTGTMKVADEEYGMLTTNMVGSKIFIFYRKIFPCIVQ